MASHIFAQERMYSLSPDAEACMLMVHVGSHSEALLAICPGGFHPLALAALFDLSSSRYTRRVVGF